MCALVTFVLVRTNVWVDVCPGKTVLPGICYLVVYLKLWISTWILPSLMFKYYEIKAEAMNEE